MDRSKHKATRRRRRHGLIRTRISGTPDRPRLSVYKSNNHFYAQVIDDLSGATLAAASTSAGKKNAPATNTGNAKAAADVGTRLAAAAKAKGIAAVVFDRGGFKYHGRVKAFADAARKAGLKF